MTTLTLTLFMEAQTGQAIADKQNEINRTEGRSVIATQLEHNNLITNDQKHQLYDAWIYYRDSISQ